MITDINELRIEFQKLAHASKNLIDSAQASEPDEHGTILVIFQEADWEKFTGAVGEAYS